MPRNVNRQANRANPLTVSPWQFCRRSVFLPFIETVLEQLSESDFERSDFALI